MSDIDDKRAIAEKFALEDKKRQELEKQLQKAVFATDEGKQLLDFWVKRHLIDLPADMYGQDLYQLGRAEGIKSFVRNLAHFQQQAAEGMI